MIFRIHNMPLRLHTLKLYDKAFESGDVWGRVGGVFELPSKCAHGGTKRACAFCTQRTPCAFSCPRYCALRVEQGAQHPFLYLDERIVWVPRECQNALLYPFV